MKRYLLLLLFYPLILSCGRPPYTSGEAVYSGECAQCHRLNGKGGDKGPDLSDTFLKHNEEYLRNYTMDPRSIKPDSIMPPAKLSDPELDILVQYIREQNRHASNAPK